MYRFFSSILSLFFGKKLLSIPYEVIIDYAVARIRILAKSAAISFSGLVLILTGLLVSFFNLLSIFDQKGMFLISAVSIGGLCICSVGILLIVFSSYKKNHPAPITRPSEVFSSEIHSPLELAFANLINEYVESRRLKSSTQHPTESGSI